MLLSSQPSYQLARKGREREFINNQAHLHSTTQLFRSSAVCSLILMFLITQRWERGTETTAVGIIIIDVLSSPLPKNKLDSGINFLFQFLESFHLLFFHFLFRRTNTMIEIITTRFHEAYTWILPPEQHVSHGSFMREQQHMFSKYKRMNGNSHKTPLLDGDKSIHVINIWFLSPLCHFPFCLLASLHLHSRSGVEQTHYCGNGRQAKLAQINFHSSLNSLSVFRNFLP